MGKFDEFTAYRQKLNKKILEQGNLEIKRFFALDGQVYQPGALTATTKELLGLAASMVLRRAVDFLEELESRGPGKEKP